MYTGMNWSSKTNPHTHVIWRMILISDFVLDNEKNQNINRLKHSQDIFWISSYKQKHVHWTWLKQILFRFHKATEKLHEKSCLLFNHQSNMNSSWRWAELAPAAISWHPTKGTDIHPLILHLVHHKIYKGQSNFSQRSITAINFETLSSYYFKF